MLTKIMVVQAAPRIGDFKHNFDIIYNHCLEAVKNQCEICVFTEMVTTGYIPEDLLLKPAFIADLSENIFSFAQKTHNLDLNILLPTPFLDEDGKLYNAVILFYKGKILGKTYKHHLPNYGVFDEKRYFSTNGSHILIDSQGLKLGVPICEDIWFPDVVQKLKDDGAELLIVPNASPYNIGKFDIRLNVMKDRNKESNLAIIYSNQVLGQDGIIFDGRSIIMNKKGKIIHQLQSFSQDYVICSFDRKIADISLESAPRIMQYDLLDEIYSAMVFGLREYIANNGYKKALLGLSGGVDSALVLAIAIDALGVENVEAIIMPSPHNTQASMDDAMGIVDNTKVGHRIIPITPWLETAGESLRYMGKITYENLQARIRGIILMSISNDTNALLLTTGNKSEIATGYCTLYGDMCGAFNPIKDIYKTQANALTKFRNNNIPKYINVLSDKVNIIPERVLTKEPSAELRYGQKDTDSLPAYDLLDKILYLYIEQDLGLKEIVEQGFEKEIVHKVIGLVDKAEFKRKQAAVGNKISMRNMAKERRYPITNLWKE